MIHQLLALKGRTFSTLTQNKKFTVESVSESGVVVRVHSTSNSRSISRGEIEKAWIDLQQHGSVTQTQLFEKGSRNSAYIVVLLSNLPGVKVRLSPVQLYLEK